MKKTILLFWLLLFMFSCSNDDSGNSNNLNNLDGAYISANVNGNSFLATQNELGLMAISAALVESDFLFSMGIAGVDLNDNLSGQGEGIALAFTGPDFDEVNDGFEIIDTEEDSDYNFAGAYDFTLTGDEEQDFEYVENSGYIKITDLNKTDQIISGEFSFTVVELISGITYEVTQGVFNEIEYTTE